MKLSIRTKIISGFTLTLLIGMFLGLYCFYSIYQISKLSANQTDIQNATAEISDVLVAHYTWRQNLTVAVMNNSEFTGSYDPITCALGKWLNNESSSIVLDEVSTDLLGKVDVPHKLIHTQAKYITELAQNGDVDQAEKIFTETILPNADLVISLLGELAAHYDSILNDHTLQSNAYESSTLAIITWTLVAAFVLNIFLTTIITKSIMNPLKRLTDAANSVAKGNFSVNLKYEVDDEIGKLTYNFAVLVDTFRSMLSDMNVMAQKHSAGEIDYMMESDRYDGEFKYVITGTNNMIGEYIDNVNKILDIVKQYADGHFSAKLDQFPGKKAVANNILDMVSNNLVHVEDSIKYLVNSATAGELDKRIDGSSFSGDWKDIISGMNNLLETVDQPLTEAEKVLTLVSEGKLDANITGKYNGRFKMLSDAINKTIEVLSMYIFDISGTLNKLATDNFDVTITKEYYGNFSDIKVSLNAIINRLNNVMREIGAASEQVASGATQISSSSLTLSHGASEQASAVQELHATIDTISDQTNKNAEFSTDANNLSLATKENAMRGNVEMSDMLKSMSEINLASQNISKIIKVIDEIAFQTNLLALNAAVEAARAGEHGKGFAVVAEEVRSLAARTSNAAKETTELIEQTIAKVNEGARIADNTAIALNKIVDGVASVSEIISEIEVSSKTQTASFSQINEGIKQISQVTQQNSATSEECAAASEELSGQSEMLKQMITRFKLLSYTEGN